MASMKIREDTQTSRGVARERRRNERGKNSEETNGARIAKKRANERLQPRRSKQHANYLGI
jgi:hypothetical protein